MNNSNNNWRKDVIYQIYPRSYYAANGKGIGDIPGINSKLDYIQDLGIDRVWLSPFFKSPMKDYGYDVADYCKVDPMFGTNDDFFKLVKDVHSKGMTIIIDQVYNHTSDAHEWFADSVASGDKKDWYVWADAKEDGTPPNNWLSIFGGCGWQWHSKREQYYLHQFLKEQPDLDFNNPEVVNAILEVAEFWMNKGVDGFRLDTAHCYTQDKDLRDNPPVKDSEFFGSTAVNPYFRQNHLYDVDYKRNVPFFEKLRKVTDKYPNSFVVGEVGGNEQLDTLCRYTQNGDRLHSVYIFCFLSEFNTQDLYRVFKYLEANLGDGYPCWAFSNHDVTRSASRGNVPKELQNEYNRFMMTLLLTMRGVPCLYQGEELGLPEADISFEDLQDPYGKEFWPEFKGRDGCRTPMPWEAAGEYGGFSKEKPWLPVPQEHRDLAVDLQEKDPNSMLWFTRQMLQWRKQQSAILEGDMQLVETNSPEVFAFIRQSSDEDPQKIFFAFNYSPNPTSIETTMDVSQQGQQLVSNDFFSRVTEDSGKISIPPYGVFIAAIK